MAWIRARVPPRLGWETPRPRTPCFPRGLWGPLLGAPLTRPAASAQESSGEHDSMWPIRLQERTAFQTQMQQPKSPRGSPDPRPPSPAAEHPPGRSRRPAATADSRTGPRTGRRVAASSELHTPASSVRQPWPGLRAQVLRFPSAQGRRCSCGGGSRRAPSWHQRPRGSHPRPG